MSLNACHCYGVITFNQDKATKVFAQFEAEHKDQVVHKKSSSHNGETRIYLDTGECLVWVRPTEYSRGFRYHKAWVDKDLNADTLRLLVYPKLYMKKEDIIWI